MLESGYGCVAAAVGNGGGGCGCGGENKVYTAAQYSSGNVQSLCDKFHCFTENLFSLVKLVL